VRFVPARWSSETPARRLRAVGLIVLIAGLGGAGLFYWKVGRSSTPSMDDLLPGYAQQRARQNEILMGTLVVTLLAWADALKDPTTQAVMLAGASALVAVVCFRVAALMESAHDDDQPRPKDG
jgi:hypothetical protein